MKSRQTMDLQAYEQAFETLKKVDRRIPSDVIQKAIQLLFSTYLLPNYDLRQAHIRELPSTNMLALIFPLPDSSHFQMPPPFRKRQNHTWALLHGTTLRTSQLILLDQPTGLTTKTFNGATCQPSGPFTLAEKYPTVTRPSQIGRQESFSTPSRRRGKDSKTSSLGRCIEVEMYTLHTRLVATKWRSSL